MAKNGYRSFNWDLEGAGPGAGPSAPLQPDGDIVLLPRLRETAAPPSFPRASVTDCQTHSVPQPSSSLAAPPFHPSILPPFALSIPDPVRFSIGLAVEHWRSPTPN